MKLQQTLIFSFLILIYSAFALNEEYEDTTEIPTDICSIVGTWKGCDTHVVTAANNYQECLDKCHDAGTADCDFFTFFPVSQSRAQAVCFMYKGCDEFDDQGCTNCTSGQANCTLNCGRPDCCTGNIVPGGEIGITRVECMDRCNREPKCKWYSYYHGFEGCFLYDECVTDGTLDQCGTGQHGCSNFGEPICGEDSCCSDSLDAQYALPNAAACLTTCKGQINPTCAWYAYKNSTGICVTYRNLCKIKYDVGLGTCSSGESRCSVAGSTTTTTKITTLTSTTTTTLPVTTAVTTTTTPAPTSATNCWQPGQVVGNKTSSKVPDREQCFQACVNEHGCIYVTYYSTKVCSKFKTNEGMNQGCTQCFSRDVNCH